MMDRRRFMAQAAVALAGLAVTPAVLEAADRLTWQRSLFPGSDFILTGAQANDILAKTLRLRDARILCRPGEVILPPSYSVIERCAIARIGPEEFAIEAGVSGPPVHDIRISHCTVSGFMEYDRGFAFTLNSSGNFPTRQNPEVAARQWLSGVTHVGCGGATIR